MIHSEILHWLREENEDPLTRLWKRADDCRCAHVGDEVHLRGLIEISNHCVRTCQYCGINRTHAALQRYRMTADEILSCAHQAVKFGYGTVVMQAGEDPGIDADWLADVIRRIKAGTSLAVTLSLGERDDEELALWRAAGADRYLLRFETSNLSLYNRIHPPLSGKTCGTAAPGCANAEHPRFAILRRLRKLGYEIGSGVMIGIPGQTYEDLASDIEAFASLDLEMIGVGPYLPHPQTPLGKASSETIPPQSAIAGRQCPNTELMTYKVIALARLTCPDANIPSTTALATINKATGRELGLMRGANVVMPNLTPVQYRAMYEIYPAKACIQESAADCHGCLKGRIAGIGRSIGIGRGDSPARKRHATPASRG